MRPKRRKGSKATLRRAGPGWLAVAALACSEPARPAETGAAASDAGAAPLAKVTEPGAAPSKVDGALWREVGWFPAPVRMLSEFTRPESAAVVHWLSSITPEDLSCQRALYGVDHYFMVGAAADDPDPTHVLYGTTVRRDVERCAALMKGATVQVDGALTSVLVAGRTTWLGFLALGETTVVIADADRARVQSFIDAAPLSNDAPIVSALRHVDRTADTWRAVVADATSGLLGVASTVHAVVIERIAPPDGERTVVRAWARFGNVADATSAKSALDALVLRYEREGGPAIHYTASLPTDAAELEARASVRSIAQLADVAALAQRR